MDPTPPVRRILPNKLGAALIDSPLPLNVDSVQGRGRFVDEDVWIRLFVELEDDRPLKEDLLFEKAGPRHKIFFDPVQARAAIVTCGGICPGLNTVIRSIYLELHYNYRVPEVLGLRNGYMGLNPQLERLPIRLTCEFVDQIHKEGGTMLGTSRGPQDVNIMADFLKRECIDILFCIGGDGTQRGAHAIAGELLKRGQPTAVVGIPKTIDNDIEYCERTFGFHTAVDAARNVIHLAHTEARAAPRGIGLVKLMGRHAGFIACSAILASQEANFVLIPEAPFALNGVNGFLDALERRMNERDHAVVVVAEGAGQHLFSGSAEPCRDASGNLRLNDIGILLKNEIADFFNRRGNPVDLKYIDPSYIIRSVAPTIDDQLLCDHLARRAVHAGMSGRTDLLIGYMNNAYIHVPISMAITGGRRVDLSSDLWASVIAATGQQPSFAP